MKESISMKNFPVYIAHRGLHGKGTVNFPENSLSAFENACVHGFAIELDVRFTADKRMVVFHDENTERMCGVTLEISKTPYEELKALRLDGTDEGIPLLTQALKLIAGRTAVFIELKEAPHVNDAEKRLAHLLKKYNGEYAVQSFDPLTLKRLRACAPEITRGQLVSLFEGEKLFLRKIAAGKAAWKLSKPDYLAWDLRSVTLEAALDAADIGARFVTWTADNIELIEAAEEFSTSVIFENIPLEYFDDAVRK